MPFKKGESRPKNAGRKKGTKNKLTIDVQQTAFKIFEKLGGITGAVKYFNSNRQTRGQFYNIFYKMLPSNMDIEHSMVEADDREFQVTIVHVNDKKGEEKKEETTKKEDRDGKR